MSKKITSVNHVNELVYSFANVHQVPVTDMVVGGGAALMAHGLRDETDDINVWIEEGYFARLAEREKVICHPMTDTAFKIDHAGIEFWIRKLNPYHQYERLGVLEVYGVLALIVQKRGGILRPERPKVKRDQDREDLIKLDVIYRERNKVYA
jgi:hypothetical protein